MFGFSKLDVMFARVDIDFLSGPEKTGEFNSPTAELAAEKETFGSSRRRLWFGT